MSVNYTILSGDTLEAISRKQYGFETNADLISAANPGLDADSLTTGVSIFIPDDPDAPSSTTSLNGGSNDEVLLKIGDQAFKYWDAMSITRSLDSIDTFSVSVPFQPENDDQTAKFKPFSYESVQIGIGDAWVFLGRLVNVNPRLGKSKMIDLSGYAVSGVLNDCTASQSQYPLEFNGMSLLDISQALCRPFGLGVALDGDQGAKFDRVALPEEMKIYSFISKLAQQRGLIATNGYCNMILQNETSDIVPVSTFRQGQTPLISITPRFKPQEYYSHITGYRPASMAYSGSTYTAKNELSDVGFRPLVFRADDSASGDISTAANAKLGRMYANAVSYDVTVSTWRDEDGDLFETNTILRLQSDNAMIYDDFDFLVRSVTFYKDNINKIAKLNVVLPGSFGGTLPDSMPWD